MRFRKRVQVFPGFRINISKSGISSTIGKNGLSVNVTKDGSYLNTGIPGTGLYDRKRISNSDSNETNQEIIETENHPVHGAITQIASSESSELQSSSLLDLKNLLDSVFEEKIQLAKEINLSKIELKKLNKFNRITKIFLIGFIIPIFKKKIMKLENEISELSTDFENCKIDLNIEFDSEINLMFDKVCNSFLELSKSDKLWDKTATVDINSKSKISANQGVQLEPVIFSLTKVNTIDTSFSVPMLGNANGHALYLYPTFILMMNDDLKFTLIDVKDVICQFEESLVMMDKEFPIDAEVIEEKWLKSNKDGSPDKRFSGNKKVPVFKLGQFAIRSNTGLNEIYVASNFESTNKFSTNFNEYLSQLKSL
jgi:hypothetical protein